MCKMGEAEVYKGRGRWCIYGGRLSSRIELCTTTPGSIPLENTGVSSYGRGGVYERYKHQALVDKYCLSFHISYYACLYMLS
jgi:hypothetical protein